jgi:UDP-2-acetamido-3-amino-2,3-dideoxy-glucuronate N-acetyltransferase
MPQVDPAKFPNVKVHESAYVDEPCEIGEGTSIWHFSHVMTNAKIGKGCNIGQNVVVSPDVTIGNNAKIQNNVSIYTGVIIEDDVFCGPSMVFTNVINPRCEINRRGEYSSTLIKKGASMGANCTIVCGSTIGRFSFIAAGAVVSKDVLDYALMIGVPARRYAWVCRCGCTLPETNKCTECGNLYKEVEGKLQPIRETQNKTEEVCS